MERSKSPDCTKFAVSNGFYPTPRKLGEFRVEFDAGRGWAIIHSGPEPVNGSSAWQRPPSTRHAPKQNPWGGSQAKVFLCPTRCPCDAARAFCLRSWSITSRLISRAFLFWFSCSARTVACAPLISFGLWCFIDMLLLGWIEKVQNDGV